jgi:hypothetical protein
VDPPPVSNAFSVEQAAATVPESAGAVTLNVLRSDGLGAASVGFATADGTASAADYTPASGTLEFVPGELSKSLTVPVLDDDADEPDESFEVALQSPSGGVASIGTPTRSRRRSAVAGSASRTSRCACARVPAKRARWPRAGP